MRHARQREQRISPPYSMILAKSTAVVLNQRFPSMSRQPCSQIFGSTIVQFLHPSLRFSLRDCQLDIAWGTRTRVGPVPDRCGRGRRTHLHCCHLASRILVVPVCGKANDRNWQTACFAAGETPNGLTVDLREHPQQAPPSESPRSHLHSAAQSHIPIPWLGQRTDMPTSGPATVITNTATECTGQQTTSRFHRRRNKSAPGCPRR